MVREWTLKISRLEFQADLQWLCSSEVQCRLSAVVGPFDDLRSTAFQPQIFLQRSSAFATCSNQTTILPCTMAALLGHFRYTLPQFHGTMGRQGPRPGIKQCFVGSKARFVVQVFNSAQDFEDVLPGSAQDFGDPLKQAGLAGSPDAQDSEGKAAAMKREAKKRKAERLKARKAARRKERQAQIPPPEDVEFWNKFKVSCLDLSAV